MKKGMTERSQGLAISMSYGLERLWASPLENQLASTNGRVFTPVLAV